MQIVISNREVSGMKKYIIKLHFEGIRTLTFARELNANEKEVVTGILEAERSAGILDGYEIREVRSFESTF